MTKEEIIKDLQRKADYYKYIGNAHPVCIVTDNEGLNTILDALNQPTPAETRRKAFDEVVEAIGMIVTSPELFIELIKDKIPDFKTEKI